MDKSSRLVPMSVTLTAEQKYFSREDGRSDGSMISVTFHIPEGISDTELKKLMFQEKERLDLFVLIANKLSGSLSDELYTERRAEIKTGYNKLLQRENGGNGT